MNLSCGGKIVIRKNFMFTSMPGLSIKIYFREIIILFFTVIIIYQLKKNETKKADFIVRRSYVLYSL